MNLIESIPSYKRYLRRKNLSAHTVKNYLHRLQLFVIWAAIPVDSVTLDDIKKYIDVLLDKGLTAQTINAHLIAIRRFYNYLIDEENSCLVNPVKQGLTLRVPSPLPRHKQEGEISRFFAFVDKPRDKAIFMLMLRCGLRVEEVANLTIDAIDYSRSQVMVRGGKGNKDRVVFIRYVLKGGWREWFRSKYPHEEKS